MDKKSDENGSTGPDSQEGRRGNNSLLIALILAGLVLLLFYNRGEERSLISASFFQEQLAKENIERVSIGEHRVYGTFKIRPEAPPLIEEGVPKIQKDDDGQPLKVSEEVCLQPIDRQRLGCSVRESTEGGRN